ncbi:MULTISPECIES: sensor histidine kinase [unclassified Arthrobacter]|uniref:sensor histidine kinase n=1 Tax=unclassified Arthrobacter TaxID=235627 RepID=UPI0002FD510C|nr:MULTISPECIES: sensor histidine kinase [unclassified Arthrobacter]PVE19703.1 sensor histidine kinase [Arthrobacter sp. Bz4]
MSEKASVEGAAERTAAASFTELNARRLGPFRRYFRSHPRVTDALIVVLYLAASLPQAIVGTVLADRWLALIPVVAAGIVLFWRRDRPLIVLGILMALEWASLMASDGEASVGFGVWFALYAVAVQHPFRSALWALAGAALLTITPLWFVDALFVDEAPYLIWIVTGFVLMWYFLAVGFGVTTRKDREHETALRDWAIRNAELASATERNRIAREMHDVVAHSLSVMIALSDGAAVVMKRDQDRAREVLDELSTSGRTALADMRRVLGVLRENPDAAPREPLPAAGSLSTLLDGFRAAGLSIRLGLSGPGLPEDPAFQLTIYRIIQESLTNVLRYGKSVTTVDVAIARTGTLVRVRVSDDGRGSMGPVVSVGSGQGIAGMQERAAIYSGTVDCGPGPDGGWVVDARLVIPEEQQSTNRGAPSVRSA